MTILFYSMLFMFVLVAIILCASILVQESKSMGLGAAFGGDAGDSLFGTSTADVLKKFTAWVAAIFMVCCIVLSMWSSGLGRSKIKNLPVTIEQNQAKE